MNITMRFDRETKNCKLYREEFEEGATPVLRSLYLSKPAAEALGNPEAIRVTVEAEA